MRIEIEVPDYSPEGGMQMKWEDGSLITAHVKGQSLLIRANQEGLLSLARLLLTLTSPAVPGGSHWHLDASNSLEDGSDELIIERT